MKQMRTLVGVISEKYLNADSSKRHINIIIYRLKLTIYHKILFVCPEIKLLILILIEKDPVNFMRKEKMRPNDCTKKIH